MSQPPTQIPPADPVQPPVQPSAPGSSLAPVQPVVMQPTVPTEALAQGKKKTKGTHAGREGRPRVEYVPTYESSRFQDFIPQVYAGRRTRSGRISDATYQNPTSQDRPSTSDDPANIRDDPSSSNQVKRSSEPNASEPAAKRAQAAIETAAQPAPPVLMAPVAPPTPSLAYNSPTPPSDNDPATIRAHGAPPPPVNTRQGPALPSASDPSAQLAPPAPRTIKPDPEAPPAAADPLVQQATPPPPVDPSAHLVPPAPRTIKPDPNAPPAAPNFQLSNPLNSASVASIEQLLKGEITIYPESVTFQPIYEVEGTACIKLYNTTTYRLSYQLETNAPTRLELSPLTTSGILKPLSFVLVHIKRQGFMMDQQRDLENDRIVVKWTNTPLGTNWRYEECLKGGEVVNRQRVIKVKYAI